MDEPNVVNEEEQEQEEQVNTSSIKSPTPPKRPNLRMAGRTAVKTTANIARKVMQIFAAMPLPVKIGIIALIAVIILVCVILEVEAEETSKPVTESIDHVVNNSETITEEAKTLFEESGSLIKMPIDTILEIFDYYMEEGEFSGTSIRKNYTYVIGTNDVEIREGTGSSSSSSTVTGDMAGLVSKAKELAEKGGKYYCQNEAKVANSVEELDTIQKWDCSSFVASMYKACLGLDIGRNTSAIYSNASTGNVGGWKVEIHAIGDGEPQAGDVLYRDGHVSLYVGDNMHVNHGGPNASDSCFCNSSWRGPELKQVSLSSYTHYIRYTKQ